LKMEFVLRAIPEARFVFITRDVEGVALSWARRAETRDPYWRADRGFEKAVRMWTRGHAELRKIRNELGPDRVAIVDYHRIFSEEKALLSLLAWLRVESDAEMTRAHAEAKALYTHIKESRGSLSE